MNEQRVTLDISKKAMPGQIVRVGQGDESGTTIVAKVYDNGSACDLSDATAAFCMRMPDGKSYYWDDNCTVSEDTITYVVDEDHICGVVGNADIAYFEIIIGSSKYSTSRFRVRVERSASDGVPVSRGDSNEIQRAISRLDNSAITNVEASVDNGVGTPSVSVTLGDPVDGGRTLTFAFQNMKGETGETGRRVRPGRSGRRVRPGTS